ncbi:MAG: hypothetical protein ACLQAT_04660 [Candidatus Binataceae bacterium]
MISLNGTDEIKELTTLGYDVEYRQVPVSRPGISDFLRAIRESGSPFAGIINADTYLTDDTAILEAVMQHAANGMMMLERTNINPVKVQPSGPTGFVDACIFNTNPLSRIDLDIDLLIGHPWWDCWFPLAYALVGGKLMTTETPLLFHLDHTPTWTQAHFNCNGRKFIKYFLNHSSQLLDDFAAEIQCFSRSIDISEGALRSFSLWCCPRIRRMAELIRIPSQTRHDNLLSALVAVLPDHGVFGELKNAQDRIFAFEENNAVAALALHEGHSAADFPRPDDTDPRVRKSDARPLTLKKVDESTLADRLERIGNNLASSGDLSTAGLLYRASGELDLCDKDPQLSWGGPLNGQSGRRRLFCELAAHFKFEIVVETGTYRATTAEWIAQQFDVDLYTCEIDERRFYQSKAKLANLKNAFIELADSVTFLTKFASEHLGASNVLVYLDAHWGSSMPLLKELEVIRLRLPKAVVMIDDFEVPTDPGYGFDLYGGRRLGLVLLHKFQKECSIFFPNLPSEDETGARRGVVVLSWDSEVGRRLSNVHGLRPVTDSDWAAAFDEIEQKPLGSANESSIDAYDGFIDLINAAPPTHSPTKITDVLSVSGWLAVSGKHGVLPDAVFVTLTDEQKNKIYLKTRRVQRPDVMEHFKQQPNLLRAGYETNYDVKRLSGTFMLGISMVHDGNLDSCNKFAFPLSIEPTIEAIAEPTIEAIEPRSVRCRRAPVLLIKRWGAGFWSDVDHVVGQLARAEILNRVPVVQWGVGGPYGNGRDETFTLYFEPVSGLGVEGLEGSIWPECWTLSNIGDELPFQPTGEARPPYDYYQLCMDKQSVPPAWLARGAIHRNEDVLVSIFWEDPEDIAKAAPPGSRLHGKNGDELRRFIVAERLTLRPAIREQIDRFWNENLDGYPTLAVHARGSDKAVAENKTVHEQNALALQIAREWSGKVFLLSDSERYRAEWAEVLGGRLVVQSCLRTTSEVLPNFLLPGVDGYRNGTEILIDTYTAARCDRFIGTYSSNVSKYVAAIIGHQAGRLTFLDRL